MSSREPGVPVGNGFIPLSVPHLAGNEWAYLRECLDTNWVSSAGSYVDRFERVLADYVGVSHAVATVNGTAALHLALLVAGIEPDDEVLVSNLTFIAPVNAIRYVGAWPLLVDADQDSWQMNADAVAGFLRHDCERRGTKCYNKSTGRKVGAVLPVHILGHPVDMDPIVDAAREVGLPVIEDATEGLGARYKGRRVGGIGDVSCLSFNGNKLITTGGGGMLLTNDLKLANRARYLSTQAKDDPIEYVHEEIGYNYRLTNLQAAMGCAQAEQLDAFIERKREIAARYDGVLANVRGVRPHRQMDWAWSTFWMYVISVEEGLFGMNRRALMRFLDDHGIQTRPLWSPIHKDRPHRGAATLGDQNADRIQRNALCLPCSVGLDRHKQDQVCEAVLRAAAQQPG